MLVSSSKIRNVMMNNSIVDTCISLLREGRLGELQSLVELHYESDIGHFHTRTRQGSCPSITYINDPFDVSTFLDIIFDIREDVDSLKPIVEYLCTKNGDLVWKSTDTESPSSSFLLTNRLNLLLLSIYLAASSSSSSATPSYIQNVVQLIIDQKLPTLTSTELKTTWSNAFRDKNLRLHFTILADTPSRLTNINSRLNQFLDQIRIRNFRSRLALDFHDHEFCIIPKARIPLLNKTDMEYVAGFVSACIATVSEFKEYNTEMVHENIKMIAYFSPLLSTSWYTPEFLTTCIELSNQPDTSIYAIHLLSSWARLTPADTFLTPLGNRVLQECLAASQGQILAPSTRTTVEMIALLMHIGAKISEHAQIIDILDRLVSKKDLPALPKSIYISLAELLVKTSLPRTTQLLSPFATPKRGRIAFDLDEGIQIAGMVHFVTTQRAKALLSNQPASTQGAKVKSGVELALEDVRGYFGMLRELLASDSVYTRLFGTLSLSGLIYALDTIRTDLLTKPTQKPKDLDSLKSEATNLIFQSVLDLSHLSLTELPTNTQIPEICAYLCGNFVALFEIIKTPIEPLENLLHVCTTVMLNSPNVLRLPESVFVSLSAEVDKFSQNECVSPTLSGLETFLREKVSKSSQHPLYAEIGRLSRMVGHLLRECLGSPVAIRTAGRLREFSHHVFSQWRDCKLSNTNIVSRPEFKPIVEDLFTHFKTVLFAYVLIFQHILPPPPDVHVPEVCESVLDSLQHLHFITIRFGHLGFEAWQEVVGGVLDYFILAERDRYLKRSVSSNTAIIPCEDIIETLMPDSNSPFIEPNAAVKMQILFWLSITRYLVHHVSESFAREKIIPRIKPYLAYNYDPSLPRPDVPTLEDKDLFETGHAFLLTLYEGGSRFRCLLRELAPWYGLLLIQNFPEPIDFDLLRRGLSIIIRGLTLPNAAPTSRPLLSLQPSDRATMNAFFLDEEEQEDEAEDMEGEHIELGDDGGYQVDESEQQRSQPTTKTHQPIPTKPLNEVVHICLNALIAKILTTHEESIRLDSEQVSQKVGTKIVENTVSNTAKPSRSTPLNTASPASSSLAPRFEDIVNKSSVISNILLRNKLLHVFFSQINTVPLSVLPFLLETIQGFMLTGRVWKPFIESSEGQYVALDDPMGLDVNPENSSVWKSLYDCVSNPERGYEYTRKLTVVKWYLELLKMGKEKWAEKEESKRKAKEVATIQSGGVARSPVLMKSKL